MLWTHCNCPFSVSQESNSSPDMSLNQYETKQSTNRRIIFLHFCIACHCNSPDDTLFISAKLYEAREHIRIGFSYFVDVLIFALFIYYIDDLMHKLLQYSFPIEGKIKIFCLHFVCLCANDKLPILIVHVQSNSSIEQTKKEKNNDNSKNHINFLSLDLIFCSFSASFILLVSIWPFRNGIVEILFWFSFIFLCPFFFCFAFSVSTKFLLLHSIKLFFFTFSYWASNVSGIRNHLCDFWWRRRYKKTQKKKNRARKRWRKSRAKIIFTSWTKSCGH